MRLEAQCTVARPKAQPVIIVLSPPSRMAYCTRKTARFDSH